MGVDRLEHVNFLHSVATDIPRASFEPILTHQLGTLIETTVSVLFCDVLSYSRNHLPRRRKPEQYSDCDPIFLFCAASTQQVNSNNTLKRDLWIPRTTTREGFTELLILPALFCGFGDLSSHVFA